MNEIDLIKFEQTRTDAENFYRKIEEVWCPHFQEKIIFNAKGLKHLKFQAERKARLRHDQYIRFRLLSLAPKIINKSHALQGISRRNNLEYMNINSRWEKIMRHVTYYEFVAIVDEVRVRVIIKQIEDGQKYFWSIIPFWKMNKITGSRILYAGKPETD